jgi:hypothetical protein
MPRTAKSDEELADPRDVDELVNLRQARPVLWPGEPVLAALADAMDFAQHQRIELVGRQGTFFVDVEVAEPRRRPRPDDLAHVLGEGLRAGEVHDAEALTRQAAQQAQGDDRLAGAWAAVHQDHGLLELGGLGPFARLGQHLGEHDMLAVQQHVGFLVMDHLGGVFEQLLARRVLALQDVVEHLLAATTAQVRMPRLSLILSLAA